LAGIAKMDSENLGLTDAAFRILVIEDHAALGRFIAASLASAGWAVVGPFSDPVSAMQAVNGRQFDFAVLDRMLRGEEAFAVAEALLASGVPFLLISGYERSTLPPHLHGVPFLMKPFTISALLAAIRAASVGGC
jgi:DNA-binding response OmpR family regulator